MKKYMIIFFILLSLLCRVCASEGKVDTLTKMETSVLGADYSNQKTELRLKRLEEYVYGKSKKGSNADRLKHLAKDLNADMIGQEITPCEDTLAYDDDYTPDSSVDYPVINEVEKHLSIKTKPKQSLHSRLVTIEKKLFNSVYDTDDYYTRVERIKGKVYKNENPTIAHNYDDDDIYIPEYVDEDDADGWGIDRLWQKRNSSRSSFGEFNNSKLSKLEQKILHRTYPDESNNDRLARLENSMFDTDFYYDNENERINRLEGALKGQKTADRYDSNKFQQGLNTALQIGAMVLMVLAFIL